MPIATAEVLWHPCPKCGHMADLSRTLKKFGDAPTWDCKNPKCDWFGVKPSVSRPERRKWDKRRYKSAGNRGE